MRMGNHKKLSRDTRKPGVERMATGMDETREISK